MKLRSVKNLYLVKQIVEKCPANEGCHRIIELVNKVLLEEAGSKAVLYPHNSLKESILQLRGECMCPKDIADKVGLDGIDGVDIVLDVIEDPSNYEEVNIDV